MQRQLYAIREVAKRWGVSTFTIRRQVQRGSIRTINIGARRLIPISEIERVEQFGVGLPRASVSSGAIGVE